MFLVLLVSVNKNINKFEKFEKFENQNCLSLGSLKEVKPAGWCLTDQYFEWIKQDQQSQVEQEWKVGLDYYVALTGRLVRSLQGKYPFPHMDWRFNEFPNEGTHALYSTCVEIMGLGECKQIF